MRSTFASDKFVRRILKMNNLISDKQNERYFSNKKEEIIVDSYNGYGSMSSQNRRTLSVSLSRSG